MATNKAQGGSSHYLPEEIVREILLLLPPRHLLRCRVICKAWRRLATDHDVIVEHHNRQPAQPLITVPRLQAPRNNCLEAVDLGTNKRRRMLVRFAERFPHPRPFSNDDAAQLAFFVFDALKVHASCDGLLILSFNDAYFVCNPATRQGALLPLLCDGREDILGFYKHQASAEYRVLYHQHQGNGIYRKYYYVLTLGSQEARSIELRTPSAAVRVRLRRGLSSSSGLPPVLLHGSLHWPPQQRQNGNMLVFDPVAESFSWIAPPPEAMLQVQDKAYTTQLFEMEGSIAMFCWELQRGISDLWFLEDYRQANWVCKHRVDLSINLDSLPFYPVIPYQEGDMLVRDASSGRVWHCDNKGQLLGSFDCDVLGLRITPHTLKESLVLHEFLHTQQNGGAGEWLSMVEFADGLQ